MLLVIIAALFLIGAWLGSKKGFIEGVINIISCFLGILVLVIVIKGIKNFMLGSFLSVLMALILLLVIRIIYKIVKLIMFSLKLVRALPGGKVIDKIAGAVLGIVEVLVLVWFMFLLFGSFDMFGLNNWIMEEVNNSNILQRIYYSNYLIGFM